MSDQARRAFLARTALAGAGLVWTGRGSAAWQTAPASGWSTADAILKRLVAPVFPDRDFDITRFGATAGGAQDATRAIGQAIAECRAAGGGRVVVPAGRFLTGPVRLASGVNLHLLEGATLAFSQDPKAYLPVVLTRFEGTECMNYSPFIYAFGQTNIAITGRGTLDGQADAAHWWAWQRQQATDRTQLLAWSEQQTPVAQRVLGEGHAAANFISLTAANVLIEGVTITNSPM